MKILISHDNSPAHGFIRTGLGRAFSACGHEVIIWDINSKSVFDAFDEFNPDLVLSQTYNLTDAWIKVLAERPQTKVILRASDYGPFTDEIHSKGYPILIASFEERNRLMRLRDKTGKPDFLHNHYIQSSIEKTHEGWIKDGFDVKSLCSGADVFDFTGGRSRPELESDICFVGGRWGYKSKTLDKWLLPLCGPDSKYKIKIFGNQPWGIPQYLGVIQQPFTRDALASAKICPNISEPHSQHFGYDIIERPWKLLSNNCFCISDYVEDLAKTIPEGIVFCKNSEEFKNKIDYFLNESNLIEKEQIRTTGYNAVINNHTYFHRIMDIFSWFNDDNEIKKVKLCYQSIRNQLKI
jgi:hypothetical protein